MRIGRHDTVVVIRGQVITLRHLYSRVNQFHSSIGGFYEAQRPTIHAAKLNKNPVNAPFP